MVTMFSEGIKLEATKLTYICKGRITAYCDLSNTDRSNMPIVFLANTKVAIAVDIKDKLYLDIDIFKDSKIEESTIDLLKIKDIAQKLMAELECNQFLLDENYNVICYGELTVKDLKPYHLENFTPIELTINNLMPYFDSIYKNTDNYIIYAFPDLVKVADSYTGHHLAFLLVKDYVEKRFPVYDNKKYPEKRIVSYQGFSMIFYHIKSLLKIKEVYKDVVKTGFESLSKANLLPNVPTTNWYVEENLPNLKIKRLSEINSKKETVIGKINRKVKENFSSGESLPVDIPEYFSHLFDKDSPTISWQEFVTKVWAWETGQGYDRWNDVLGDFYVHPTIIIPDNTIMNINKKDILFIGFDGEEIKMSINSKTNSKVETVEEAKLKSDLATYLLGRYGLESEIVLDYEKTTIDGQVNYIDDDE